MFQKLVLLLPLFCLLCADDTLLKMGEHSSCIRQVIDSFIQKESCQQLSDTDKSMLAHKMVSCINIKHGKKALEPCETPEKCSISGEDWGTFAAFFTHIDNLCHFYWEVLHHEKTEKLISSLSDSALLSEGIMKKNFNSTQKILSMQQIIRQFMEESIQNNKGLANTLQSSEVRLQNMTANLQVFFKNLHRDIDQQYSSLSNILSAINQGIQSVNMLQEVMRADLGSIFGLLYFLVMFLALGVLTSLHIFRPKRLLCFLAILTNLLLECILPYLVLQWVGCYFLRFTFILAILTVLALSLFNTQGQNGQMTAYIQSRLETERIKRIFKQIIHDSKDE